MKSEEVKIDKLLSKLVDFWPTRQDSNLRSRESESRALSIYATGRNIPLRILYHFFFSLSINYFKVLQHLNMAEIKIIMIVIALIILNLHQFPIKNSTFKKNIEKYIQNITTVQIIV